MSNTPKWLRKIQQNSWEPEILISGGAIFTLLTLSDDFIYWFRDAKVFLGLHFPGTSIIIFLMIIAIEGIKTLFIFHLLIRAYWTGLIGLSFVFPDGIGSSRINELHPLFRYTVTDSTNIAQYIQKVENIASLVFAITIRFMLSVIGILVLLSSILMLYLNLPITIFLIIILVFGLLFIITVIDAMGDMKFRKSQTLGPLFFPIYRIMDTISLSFIMRPITQILMARLTPKRIAPMAVGILSISGISAYSTMTAQQLIKPYYDGKLYKEEVADYGKYIDYHYLNHWSEGAYKPPVQIGRDVVAEYATLMVFIEYLPEYDDQLVLLLDAPDGSNEEAFRNSVRMSISGSQQMLDNLVFGRNPKTNRLGLIGYYNLEKLNTGKHSMVVELFSFNEGLNKGEWTPLADIPFWKE
ncbi:MAG: hypothetical protein JXQ90_00600 [Cyclobacteriaceae bacterium]